MQPGSGSPARRLLIRFGPWSAILVLLARQLYAGTRVALPGGAGVGLALGSALAFSDGAKVPGATTGKRTSRFTVA